MAAQTPGGVGELLSIPPVERLTCRKWRLEHPSERTAFSYVFEVGTGPFEDNRSIHVTYTTSGALAILSEQNSFKRDGLNVNESAVVFVMPDDTIGGKKIRFQLSPDDRGEGSVATQEMDLTPDELAKARPLAAWLWERRCDK